MDFFRKQARKRGGLIQTEEQRRLGAPLAGLVKVVHGLSPTGGVGWEKEKKKEKDKVLVAKGQRSRLEKGSVQERSRVFRLDRIYGRN